MKTRFAALSIAALCMLPSLVTSAQTRQIDFAELDRTVAEEMAARNVPGATIAVVVDGRVVYTKGYGVTSVETRAPMPDDALFRIGSTNKMFTAAALVALADRGKVRLDAPIGTVVEGLDPSLARLTPHQLLSQSSGLRDFASPVTSQDEDALGRNVRSWHDDVFFTDPGAIYSYSSPGYWLAGYVAEAVNGKPYADTMDELLFTPLGMTRTTLRPLVAVTYPFAQGHTVTGEKVEVVRPVFNNAAMWPGGSIYSNVHDLSRFAIALMQDGEIDGTRALPHLVATSLPAHQVRFPGPFEAWYGYGLVVYTERGVEVASHGGATRGYGSSIDMVPAKRFAVIVLSNKSGETLSKSRAKAMELALDLAPEAATDAPKAIPMTAAEMASYAGRYVHEPMVWEISVKGGKLVLTQDGTDSELIKVDENAFSLNTPGQAEIVLVPGPDGKMLHLFVGLYSARRADRPIGK